uniref:4HBT domain-containing protein n=1 Tax=Panagrellus redivivus TaxID=6233 RepID=A0A7E4W596_PANRE
MSQQEVNCCQTYLQTTKCNNSPREQLQFLCPYSLHAHLLPERFGRRPHHSLFHTIIMTGRRDELAELKLKWANFLPTFEHSFLKEVRMCTPLAIKNNQSIAFEFTVLPEMCNIFKTLHGGSAATIIDTLMGWTIVAEPGQPHPFHVTTDLDLNFLNGVPEGEKVILRARVVGRNAAGVVVIDGQLVRASDGLVYVDAKQTLMHVDSGLIRGKNVTKTKKDVVQKMVESSEMEKDLRTERFNRLWRSSYSADLFTKYPTMWKLIYAKPGANLYEIQITQEATNSLGIVHGGFIATAIDSCTCSTAVTNKDIYRVSVALHVSYLAQSRVGDILQLRTKTINETDSRATVSATIFNKLTGAKIATGYQTVADIKPPAHTVEHYGDSKAHL